MHPDGSLVGGRKSSKTLPIKENQLSAWLKARKQSNGCCCSSWGRCSHEEALKALGEQGGESGRVRRRWLHWHSQGAALTDTSSLCYSGTPSIPEVAVISCQSWWHLISYTDFLPWLLIHNHFVFSQGQTRSRVEMSWELRWNEKEVWSPKEKHFSVNEVWTQIAGKGWRAASHHIH